MPDLDFESSQLQILTDALRAGPGSPQWREALATLENTGGVDEYKLLYAARERLASGQRYREVQAGPTFTRNLNDAINREGDDSPRTLPSANLIAAAGALVILGILAVVTFFLIPRGTIAPTPSLSETYFVNTLSQADFTNDPDLGTQWSAFGSLGIEIHHGLRPTLTNLKDDFRGGGISYQQSLAPTQPFAIDATVRVPADDNQAVQLFVSDEPNFSGQSSTSGHELVCLVRGGEISVFLPGGHVAGQVFKIDTARRSAKVRLIVNRDQAAVEVNGKMFWSGANDLSADKSRQTGVRFLARTGAKSPTPVVESIRLLTPQK